MGRKWPNRFEPPWNCPALRCSAGRGPFRACGVVFSRLYSPSGAPGGQGAVATAPTATPISTSSAAIDRARPDRCGGAAGAALSQGRRGAGAAGLLGAPGAPGPLIPRPAPHLLHRCSTRLCQQSHGRSTVRLIGERSERQGEQRGGARGGAWGAGFLAHPVRSVRSFHAARSAYYTTPRSTRLCQQSHGRSTVRLIGERSERQGSSVAARRATRGAWASWRTRCAPPTPTPPTPPATALRSFMTSCSTS